MPRMRHERSSWTFVAFAGPRISANYSASLRKYCPKYAQAPGTSARLSGSITFRTGFPIMGVAGDQQASLIGQGCVAPGQAKCTFGTGAFLLAHTGDRVIPSGRGLITTLAATLDTAAPQYALEGSVFVAGAAVQWFRDGLKAIGASPEINPLALESDPDNEVVFVPALDRAGRTALGAFGPRGDLRAHSRHGRRRPGAGHARRRRVPGRGPD